MPIADLPRATAVLATRLRAVPREAWCWAAVLLAAALTDPAAPPLAGLCPFDALGLWCPGDGLGTGIAYALDGEIRASFASHPLAPAAVLVLGAQLARLLHRAWRA